METARMNSTRRTLAIMLAAALGLLGWALAARLRAIHATTPVRLQPSASKG
jgi:hypothetical protein